MKNYDNKNNPVKDNDQSVTLRKDFEAEKRVLDARIFLASSQCRGTDENFLYAFGCE